MNHMRLQYECVLNENGRLIFHMDGMGWGGWSGERCSTVGWVGAGWGGDGMGMGWADGIGLWGAQAAHPYWVVPKQARMLKTDVAFS